jgi:uncharacterized membrane protein YfcA
MNVLPIWAAASLSAGWSALVVAAGVLAGAVASVAGFGIGSVLTPLLAWNSGTRFAVAAVSIPHFVGTALRLFRMRKHVDRRVLVSFGIASAVGGLAGALLHVYFRSPVLAINLGMLLVFAGTMQLTGFAKKLRFEGPWAWVAGAASGAFGGLVGNQGGIRSAAMLGFHQSKEAFVATATSIALIIDLVRMPVYFAFQFQELLDAWPIILTAIVGVVAGTLLGERVLRRIPEAIFQRVLGALILALGVLMFVEAGMK